MAAKLIDFDFNGVELGGRIWEEGDRRKNKKRNIEQGTRNIEF
jgi:hypothetical protein